jgi:predicted esterase
LKFEDLSHVTRASLLYLSLACGVLAALAILLSVVPPAQGQTSNCEDKAESLQVPGAEKQDEYCLEDMTTKGLVEGVTTSTDDWSGLNSTFSTNPPEPVPGIQVNGYFPDDSNTNNNNGYQHDSQFVIRLPRAGDWNGKLIITGAPGVRGQYANDYIISDYVLSKGYAFASTDKGNTGTAFYDDGSEPGGSVAEWHHRVEQLTRATKKVVEQRYDQAPKRTYITGISNGGYLTRYALENTPELYDGGVDWEGTLFRAGGPNLLTYLPASLEHYPECRDGDQSACQRMIEAGFQSGSQPIWPEHYLEYWDLTQRIYREEFDPEYDGDQKAGYAFCGELPESTRPQGCDADYDYESRPQRVKDAVGKVSLTGKIGKPMLTLHGTLDALLPIKTDSNVYRELIKDAGKGNLHRYYKIEDGNHVDSYYDRYTTELRPILPCHRAALEALEEWVEEGNAPPKSKLVSRPEATDPAEEANRCSLGKGAKYSADGAPATP